MMRAQSIELDEAAAVEQDVETLAGEKFSLFPLAPGALFAAARFRFLVQLAEFVEVIDGGHEKECPRMRNRCDSAKESVNHSKSRFPVNQIGRNAPAESA